jgi:hypothetical protein
LKRHPAAGQLFPYRISAPCAPGIGRRSSSSGVMDWGLGRLKIYRHVLMLWRRRNCLALRSMTFRF